MKQKLLNCIFFIFSPPGFGLFILLFLFIALIDYIMYGHSQLRGADVYYTFIVYVAGIITGKFL